jgi:UDP-glucose 4-epimerase
LETKQKILVTGGAGFIGYNLVKLLAGEGWQVRVLDNLSVEVGRRDWNLGEQPVEFIQGDVSDLNIVREAVQGVGAVIHLSARPGVADSVADPQADFEANVVATLQLLQACVAEKKAGNDPIRFVFASSGAATGDVPPPAHELQPARPVSPYAAAKLAGEGYCSAFWGSYGLHTTALRFSNIYGKESWHKKNAIHIFSKQILRGEKLLINGDGEQTRDFLFVEDLVEAIKACITLPDLAGGDLFQLGSGKPTSVNQLLAVFREVSDTKFEVVYGPARRGDVRHTYADISKARKILNFNPQTGLKTGLTRTFEWYKANKGRYEGKIKEVSGD